MSLTTVLFVRRLASDEEEKEQIGPLSGIPVLGLDALASASYGPEAALTVLLPLGALGVHYIVPLSALVIGLLAIVYVSYRQTIAAYPSGGGSYIVAKENLGTRAGLVAAAALLIDYVLNVAVAVSAGVGAMVSAVPALLPHTLGLCLAVLVVLTAANLRGLRTAGLVFLVPTYAFLGCLFAVIGIGIGKTILHGGHPPPVVAPPSLPVALGTASLALLCHSFASGCTAMTGVEAVSNGVPAFRKPSSEQARRTLSYIVASLGILLAGIAILARAYGITATEPGKSGYQSIVSQIVGAVVGRGAFYYVTLAAVVAVLMLSANTSFADFPRLCRLLALDRFLPEPFIHRGRPRLLLRHRRPRRTLGPPARRLPGHHRRPHPALRGGRVPRLHDVAGGDDRALAQGRRRALPAPPRRQRDRRHGHGRHARRHHHLEVHRGGVDLDPAPARGLSHLLQCATPLRAHRRGGSRPRAARPHPASAADRGGPHQALGPRGAEGAPLRAPPLA
ncbi:APC family permease [Sorangium sp. So ce128]|uniref:APC family permease n=1 Tax=Sorangium sp. So ce128 TaxID=3133281 RepID=UPI003F5E372C